MRLKFTDPYDWHRWVAWFPVVVDGRIVWLEAVERRIVDVGIHTTTEYRLTQAPM